MKPFSLKIMPHYILGLLTMAFSSWLMSWIFQSIPQLGDAYWLLQLGPAFLCMIGALVAHLRAKGRKGLYMLSYFLNAAGSGLAVGAVLGAASILPPPQILLALTPAAAIGCLVCLLFILPGKFWRGFTAICGTVLALVLVGFGIYFWICVDPLTGCAFVFSGLFYLPFPIGCNAMLESPQERYRYLSFTGFGAFMLIAFVAVFILSEGEILDGLDLGGGDGKKAKKAKKVHNPPLK